jgi:hypothetical protein
VADNIRDHRFADAYAYLGPDVAKGKDTWISSHEQDGITDVQYDFSVSGVTGRPGDHCGLRTATPTGCLAWSASYRLIRQDGCWFIDRVDISSTPCDQ